MQNKVNAQQIFLSNQHIVNKYSLSPAYAGTGELFGVFGSYRRDWMGVSGAPELKVISANGSVCKNMGLGGSISAQQAGIFTNLSAMLSYAYHVKLSGSSFLSFGLGIGILEKHLDLSNNESINDPYVYTVDRTSSMLDASFGILFRYKNLSFGFGSPRVLSNKESESRFIWTNRQVHLQYKFSFNNTWAVEPTILYLPKEPQFAEISLPIIYQQKIWLNLLYKKSSMGIGVGAKLKSNFVFNYTYELYQRGIASSSGGTHEITLGWKLINKKNDGQPKPDNKKPYYDWVNK
ncbi:MAG: hypothetical protein A2X08_14625 [Bacteroidetes bacterium GWA2_32_17]|nr:MAG: hypothetical protein A2X08_14625 [Bacteroidetes bacterium GWA2_32_17]